MAVLSAPFGAGPDTLRKSRRADKKSAATESLTRFASLIGTFGYSVDGWAGNSPLAAAGILIADGSGNVSGTETSQTTGYGVQTTTFTGTYTLDNSRGGDLTIAYPAPPLDPNNPGVPAPAAATAGYHFVFVNGQTQLKAVRTDSGVAATADFRMQ